MGRPTSLALAFLPRLKPMLSLSLEDCCALESFGSCAAKGRAAASITKNSARRRMKLRWWMAAARGLALFASRFIVLKIVILCSVCERLYIREASRECSIGARADDRGEIV